MVGTTIALTMIINIITPHVGTFFFIIYGGFKRCVDRGCSCDKRKTKMLL
jgi:hypothetical protein